MVDESTNKTAKRIEIAANVAIVIVALAAISIFARNFWARPAQPHHTIATGTKFDLKDENWQTSRKSVVLALSTTCRFCTESAGFYRELSQECKKQHIHLVAVLPQPVNEAKAYLQGESVAVDEVKQASFAGLQVSGTPTLLIIDDKGIVKNVWYGKLADSGEKEVLATLPS